MQKRLSVINTVPNSNSVNVKTDTSVEIHFDKDLSKSSLNGNIYMLDGRGEKVDSTLSYSNRVVVIKSREGLRPATSYRIVIKGDNDPNNALANKGVTSPIGDRMLGDYTFSFSTESPFKETEKIEYATPTNIALKEQPVFKGGLSSGTINVVRYVDIEVSTSNTFEPSLLHWAGRCDATEFISGTQANKFFSDGVYYWRARCVSDVNGEWSDTFQFAVEIHSDVSVTPDDYVDVDIAFPNSWDMMEPEVSEIYPSDKRSAVATNLKTLSIELDQIVPLEELSYSTLSLFGGSVEGDAFSENHGDVDVDIDVVYDHSNNKTIIIATLPVIKEG